MTRFGTHASVRIDAGAFTVLRFSDGSLGIVTGGEGHKAAVHLNPKDAARLAEILADLVTPARQDDGK